MRENAKRKTTKTICSSIIIKKRRRAFHVCESQTRRPIELAVQFLRHNLIERNARFVAVALVVGVGVAVAVVVGGAIATTRGLFAY